MRIVKLVFALCFQSFSAKGQRKPIHNLFCSPHACLFLLQQYWVWWSSLVKLDFRARNDCSVCSETSDKVLFCNRWCCLYNISGGPYVLTRLNPQGVIDPDSCGRMFSQETKKCRLETACVAATFCAGSSGQRLFHIARCHFEHWAWHQPFLRSLSSWRTQMLVAEEEGSH